MVGLIRCEGDQWSVALLDSCSVRSDHVVVPRYSLAVGHKDSAVVADQSEPLDKLLLASGGQGHSDCWTERLMVKNCMAKVLEGSAEQTQFDMGPGVVVHRYLQRKKMVG